MSEPVLTAQEVLKWNESTSVQWRKFLSENPAILTLPCDIASNTTIVAQLLQHIVAVELRYAERIAHIPETPYDQVPYDSVDAIYATHDRAIEILQRALTAHHDWNETLEFQTRSYGTMRATAKTIYFHALFHGIRHYAQLGTLVRQHGYKPTWLGDYLAMGVQRV
jgi:uncharacterized damage-inducible protein DinB